MRYKADSMGESVSDAIRVAAESMGYPELRRLQETAVRAFVTGRDVFVSIPMSSGKSLCYSVPPSVFDILRGSKPQFLESTQSWDAVLRAGRYYATQQNSNYSLVTIT